MGIGAYDHLEVDTSYDTNDAIEISNCFASYWGANNIQLILDSDAIKANIKDSIDCWLAPNEKANDLVLFYFAGHGTTELIGLLDSKGVLLQDIILKYESL